MPAHPPGIKPGLWLKYYRSLADLERARRAAMQPVRDIQKKISAVRRAAQRDGANLFAMHMLDAVSRQTEEVAQQSVEEFRHYAAWASLPIGTQGMLFSQPEATEIIEHDEWLAEEEFGPVRVVEIERRDQPRLRHRVPENEQAGEQQRVIEQEPATRDRVIPSRR